MRVHVEERGKKEREHLCQPSKSLQSPLSTQARGAGAGWAVSVTVTSAVAALPAVNSANAFDNLETAQPAGEAAGSSHTLSSRSNVLIFSKVMDTSICALCGWVPAATHTACVAVACPCVPARTGRVTSHT